MGEEKLKKNGITALFWVLLSLVILGGATFAWFTFISYTNVKPMTGTVGNGGADLKIANSEDGPYGEETELIVNGSVENLQPVSTANQQEWYTAVSHNSQGITTKYQSVTDKIDEYSMYGSLYLQSSGGACDVYFDAEQLHFDGDPQLLAAARLSFSVSSQTAVSDYLFNFDSYVNSAGLESQITTERESVVISSVTGDGNPSYEEDSSESFQNYAATVAEGSVTPGGQLLIHMSEDEIVRVDWRLYMEGCDPHCVNASQSKEISMNLAFAGVGAD